MFKYKNSKVCDSPACDNSCKQEKMPYGGKKGLYC